MIACCTECNHQFDPAIAEPLGSGPKWLRAIREPIKINCPNCKCALKFQPHPTFAKIDNVIFVLLMAIFGLAIVLHYRHGSSGLTTLLYLIFGGIHLTMSVLRRHFAEKGRYVRA